jgi:hypothetical protein
MFEPLGDKETLGHNVGGFLLLQSQEQSNPAFSDFVSLQAEAATEPAAMTMVDDHAEFAAAKIALIFHVNLLCRRARGSCGDREVRAQFIVAPTKKAARYEIGRAS